MNKIFQYSFIVIVCCGVVNAESIDSTSIKYLSNRNIGFIFGFDGLAHPIFPYYAIPGLAIPIDRTQELRVAENYTNNPFWIPTITMECSYYKYFLTDEHSTFFMSATINANYRFKNRLKFSEIPHAITVNDSYYHGVLGIGMAYFPISYLQIAIEYRIVYEHDIQYNHLGNALWNSFSTKLIVKL